MTTSEIRAILAAIHRLEAAVAEISERIGRER